MPSLRDQLANAKSKLATTKQKLEDHPANLNNHQEGSYYNVDIELIKPDPDQPRKYFDPASLEELAQSIRQKGVLQPVIIRKTDDGEIYLVAGERRFRAAKIAGLNRIPSILTKGNPAEIAIIENLQRENLKPIEEAEALNKMLKEHSYTQEQLALVIGKGRTTITETLSLNKLPEEIKEECRRADNYSRRLLVEIAKQETPEAMTTLFYKAKEGNLKSGDVRNITRKKTNKNKRTITALALDKAINLTRCLSKIDISSIEEEEKIKLVSSLQNLKTFLDEYLIS